jgi:regulator of protease activity HflC (stomatin/prohibitin superfamily)
MLALKYLLLVGAIGMFIAALAVVAYDLYAEVQRRRRALAAGITTESEPLRWRTAVALVAVAWAPLLIALSIVVVPSGMAGVRVSQVAGTRPGTLYSGVHVVAPFIDRVEMFDIRDHLYTTGVASEIDKSKDKKKAEPLNVQAKEGLTVGLAITVRYSLDPNRLDYIQSHLPQPVDTELVPPVVASAWRELVPNYTVRDVFSTKREEVRQRAEKIISSKLGADGIRVKEVMLRDIQLPPEYAKGLETLLLREQ